MTFKTGDKGQTRGGDDYEVVAEYGEWAIWAKVWIAKNDYTMRTYRIDGTTMPGDAGHDLLPPKQKIEGWAVIRDGWVGIVLEEFPDNVRGQEGVLAIVPITIPYTEGDGL